MKVAEIPSALRSRRITQNELARHLGVSRAHISQMLSGKRRMHVDTLQRIEAFLANAASAAATRGVAETQRAAYHFDPPPKPRLSEEEKDRILQELTELGDAYKLLPRITDLTDEEILGYDENGLPT